MPGEKDQPKEEIKEKVQSKSEAKGKDTARTPRYEKEKVLFEWEAPERPFKERNKEFWVSIIAIASIFCFILFIVEGVMPVILIISILFLFYILSTVKPQKIRYAITNKGVKMADTTTDMNLLVRYWFGKRFGSDLLIFHTINFPGRFELVISKSDKKKISEILGEYVPEEEVPPSNLEKASRWLSNKIPGNE